MRDYLKSALVIAGLTLVVANGHAEEKGLESVVVIGKAPPAFTTDLAGSVDVLSQEELAYEHVDDTLELFNKAPGVYLARYNQGIINTDIAIRGFAGDGVTPHARLLIDGIPANLHNGYNELDQLFPLSIASIAVFKGTSDPRYGLYNIAGNYNVTTRQDDGQEIELTLGSFGTREAQGYAGFANGAFTHSYAAGYRGGEGYRDRQELDKYALAGQWQWQFDAAKSLRVIARHAVYEGDSPGYFNDRRRARANPRRSEPFASQDGGEKETRHVSAHWQQDFGADTQWQLKAYTQTFERERWVRFSPAGALQNRYDDQDQWGLISILSWRPAAGWRLDLGADYEFQDVLEQRFRTLGNDSRRRDSSAAGVIRNRAYDFSSYGAYLQLLHEPSERLRWNIALRADRLDGDYRDRASGEQREMFNFGAIIQPKFNIVYALWDSVNVFANLGRGFQHPFGKSAYRGVNDPARDVSVNDGWEAGMQWSPSALLDLRLSYWRQNASNEFINVDGVNRNVGKTDRGGLDMAFNGRLGDAWSYWGNVALIDSEIVRAATGQRAFEGNQLRGIPDYVASLGLNYQITPRLVARVHLDAQGDYYINEANTGGKFGGYALLSASADYEIGPATVKFQLNNITDQYYEYVFDFGNDASFTVHSPGDGVNGSVSVNWRF